MSRPKLGRPRLGKPISIVLTPEQIAWLKIVAGQDFTRAEVVRWALDMVIAEYESQAEQLIRGTNKKEKADV